MRQFNEDTLTDAVIARLKDAKNPRFKQIMTSLVKHLHAFARDVELTEEEWFEGIKFLTATGQKCDDKRQEFILLSDVLGLSMMVVALNNKTVPGATEATVLGPFFAHGAPEFEYGADLREGATMKGEDTWVTGRVLSTDGKPIPNATLDIWQAKADGVYDVQEADAEFEYGADLREGATMKGEDTWVTGRVLSTDGKPIPNATLDIWQAKADGVYDVQEADAEFELRGRVKCNAKGEYAFKTYKPKFYGVPDDGPVGDMLRAMGRHPMRPAHMHAIVAAPGYQQVITHVFVDGDPYLDSDAVFAVKDSLIGKFRKVESADEAKKLGLPSPFLKLEWDFHLAPESGVKARKTIAPSDALA